MVPYSLLTMRGSVRDVPMATLQIWKWRLRKGGQRGAGFPIEQSVAKLGSAAMLSRGAFIQAFSEVTELLLCAGPVPHNEDRAATKQITPALPGADRLDWGGGRGSEHEYGVSGDKLCPEKRRCIAVERRRCCFIQ